MNDKQKAWLCLSAAGTIIVGYATAYAHTVRVEREKRRKIDEWTTMNLNCLANMRTRLNEALIDDNVSIGEFMQIWHEEQAFVRIVQNQPRY